MASLIFKTKVVFKVHNFTQLVGKQFIRSDVFSIGSDEWRVSVEVWTDVDGERVVGAFLELVRSTDEIIDVQFMFDVLNGQYEPLGGYTNKVVTKYTNDCPNIMGYKGFVNYSTLTHQMDQYLPNNTLTIAFKITVLKPLIFGPKKRPQFEKLFNNKLFNDCRLVVKDNELFASKLLLSQHSEVFEKMFSNKLSEKTTGDVIIDDIDADVVEEFLRFLYFGYSDKMDEMAEQLLYVSDKYMVNDLKTICLNLMFLQINPKNAFKILEVMNKYRNKDIKIKCFEFIKDNGFDCLESEWHKIIANNDRLVAQLISNFKDNLKPKKSTETLDYTYTYLS